MLDNNTHSKLEGPLGRRLAKFAQLILTITITDRGFSLLNRFIAGKSRSSRN